MNQLICMVVSSLRSSISVYHIWRGLSPPIASVYPTGRSEAGGICVLWRRCVICVPRVYRRHTACVPCALLNVATSLDSKYTFVVDNKTGNAGLIGMEALAEADPDGYTLGTPDDVVAALRDLMGKAVESDEYKTQIESLGMQYITLYVDELNTFINEQMAFYKDICADIDING